LDNLSVIAAANDYGGRQRHLSWKERDNMKVTKQKIHLFGESFDKTGVLLSPLTSPLRTP
jgi:hypothetical protein